MCGILAIWSHTCNIQVHDLRSALQSLAHRGPDAQAVWIAPDQRVALGHTRLSIIDLATGTQPLSNEDQMLKLVVNGEFYGYQQIRTTLAERGHCLSTASDSEILLHLYEDRGLDALHELRGEWAFVLWDQRNQRLVAARDRFGIKPLYYAIYQGQLILASEIKALLALGIPAAWDQAALFEYLHICYSPDRTLFAGIRQVPPGCYLLADATGVTIRRYWDLDYPEHTEQTTAIQPMPPTYQESLRMAFDEAIKLRLQADVPVGFHLSGGLDSSGVVGIAATHRQNLTTFTVGFDDPAWDEQAIAARTARHLGSHHHTIPFAQHQLAEQLAAAIRAGEMIQENSHGVARLLQSQAIQHYGFKVVLAGEGGDEVFAGYTHFQHDLAYSISPAMRDQTQSRYAQLARNGGIPLHLRRLLERFGFVPKWILDRYLTVTLPLWSLLRTEFTQQFATHDSTDSLLHALDAPQQLERRAPLHQSLYLFWKTWFCNYILAAERLDMASAVEVRLPFLDHRVFETARQMPLAWYQEEGRSKAPLRTILRPYITAEVDSGRKHPFFAPPAVGDSRALAFLREIAHSPTLATSPFFDQRRVIQLVERIAALPPAQRSAYEAPLQIIASVCVLSETFGMAGA